PMERALADAGVEAKTKEDARKKTELYQRHLDAGRLALSGKRYDDAIKSFTAAQKVMPGDKAAGDLLTQTQKAWSDAKLTQGDEEKRQDFNRLPQRAQTARQAKTY